MELPYDFTSHLLGLHFTKKEKYSFSHLKIKIPIDIIILSKGVGVRNIPL